MDTARRSDLPVVQLQNYFWSKMNGHEMDFLSEKFFRLSLCKCADEWRGTCTFHDHVHAFHSPDKL